MKYIFILLTFVAFITFSIPAHSNGDNPCTVYKTGTFYYHFNINGETFRMSITRTNFTQTETNLANGKYSKFKVTWLNECTYQLNYQGGTNKLEPEMELMRKKLLLKTTIIGGTKDYYLFKSTSSMSDQVLQDTMWLHK